jgi:ribosomal protein S12 methylthiotransferase accessory factor
MDLHAIDLKSPAGSHLIAEIAGRHGRALADANRLLDKLFFARSPYAPGFCFAGGLAEARQLGGIVSTQSSFSVAGNGETIEDAITSCLGEAVERVSQLERKEDVSARMPVADAAGRTAGQVLELATEIGLGLGTHHDPVDWTAAIAMTGDPTLVPTDWCTRRSEPGPLHRPGAALSTGCAAGPTFEDAAGRALLELVERDAAALWWIGGQRGRSIDLADRGVREAAELMRRLREDSDVRTSWLLDITSDLDIPVVVALSVNGNGRGLACGMAARLSMEQAAQSAILEMCMMELAPLFVDLKEAQRGVEALNETDLRHRRRTREIPAEDCLLLHPAGVPRRSSDRQQSSAAIDFAELSAALLKGGIEAALVDLTRPEPGIPVVSAIAPKLQPFPGDMATERLLRAVAIHGGGEQWTGGLPLF